MKRDTIFYQLFQRSPTVLFQLLQITPDYAEQYRFDSVSVKEPTFEIDGVLLPPENVQGTVFFVEVQFQLDRTLYERIFAETALYFYRNAQRFSDWQVVVLYPNRSTEQSRLYPHRSLLGGGQVHRIFLDELGEAASLPLWIALMVLTTVSETQAPEQARQLIQRAEAEVTADERRAIIEMITTIISYKFNEISVQEVEAMLDITFEETKVYRELKEEARKEGREEGREEGKREGVAGLVDRLLTKRFRQLETVTVSAIRGLSLDKLEQLSEDLLDFQTAEDLQNWLSRNT